LGEDGRRRRKELDKCANLGRGLEIRKGKDSMGESEDWAKVKGQMMKLKRHFGLNE
jgi:hypothetical protein